MSALFRSVCSPREDTPQKRFFVVARTTPSFPLSCNTVFNGLGFGIEKHLLISASAQYHSTARSLGFREWHRCYTHELIKQRHREGDVLMGWALDHALADQGISNGLEPVGSLTG
jgi:hypothetical protein